MIKLIVIGLDGAAFELIDPLLGEGRLPNIARIRQKGVWADMKSVLPPVTSPNWKCYSTGKNPGKIGIFGWSNVDWSNRRVYYPAARITANKEIWDYMGEAGMKVGILGMPTTYPPRKVNGFMVAGGLGSEEENFTYPPELESDLKMQGWHNQLRAVIDIDKDKAIKELHKIIEGQFRIAESLANGYHLDFLHVTCFHINILQHFLWDAPETMAAWEIIDRHVGELLKLGGDVIIMSDHGSNEIKHVFSINTWLQREGYLNLNLKLTGILNRLGIDRPRLMALLSRLGIFELARKIVPESLQRQVPDVSGGVSREAIIGKVNWAKSRAVSNGHGLVYLNPNNGKENEKLKEEIKQKLTDLVAPQTGEGIAKRVYTREEIYHGKYLAEAPDIIIDHAKGAHIPGSIGQRHVFDSPGRWQAENKDTGLFLACGPSIKQAGEIKNVSILDLAPTILHLMKIAVPDDMDGRVLKDIFRPGSAAATRDITYQSGKDKKEKERQRIRQAIKELKARVNAYCVREENEDRQSGEQHT